jgi:hypothetical protein
VTQALCSDPAKRFRSCRDFILALEEVSGFAVGVGPSARTTRMVPALGAEKAVNGPEWVEALRELVQAVGRGHMIAQTGPSYYRLTPGLEIEQHTEARVPKGMARLKMNGFCEQWKGTVLHRDEQRWAIEVPARVSLWQRFLGRTPMLLVEVAMRPVASLDAGAMTPIRFRLSPHDCSRGKAEQLLEEMGPAVLASLQTYFSSQATRADQERYPYNQAVHVQALGGLSITGRMRDLGRTAMGIISPTVLPVGPVKITINRWASPMTVQIPGRVVDCVPGEEGMYEIEVVLASAE